jgi:hypothetical protein
MKVVALPPRQYTLYTQYTGKGKGRIIGISSHHISSLFHLLRVSVYPFSGQPHQTIGITIDLHVSDLPKIISVYPFSGQPHQAIGITIDLHVSDLP